MAKVKSKNTAPEMVVRKLLHRLGYRYRLHNRELPGTPDIVFAVRKKVIFVHGCFWHGHDCKAGRNVPASKTDYWIPKIKKNRIRDEKNAALLEEQGWNVLTIWECELKDTDTLITKLVNFLGTTKK